MTKLTDAIQASLEAAIETEDAKAETEKKLSAATTAKAASDLALAAEQKKTADLTAENQALAMRVAELEEADASPPADPSPPLISPDGDAAPPLEALYTLEGEWTWGRMVDERGYALLLNGQETGNVGVEMFMFGGTIWHKNSGTPVWCGYRKDGKWTYAADPRATPAPDPAPTPAPSGTPLIGAAIWANAKGMPKILRDDWGMDAVRVVYHPTELATTAGSEADAMARIKEALALGQEVFVSWHRVSGDATSLPGEAALIDAFFGRVIAAFPGETRLWFQIWNEYGANNAQEQVNGKWRIKPAYGDAYVNFFRARLSALKAKGFKGKAVVSSLYYGQDVMRTTDYNVIAGQTLEELSSILVLGPRIVDGFGDMDIHFDVHPYNTWSKIPQTFIEFCQLMAKAGLKFVVGETGMINAKENCSDGMTKVFTARDAGYAFPILGWHSNAGDKNDFTAPHTAMTLKKDANGSPTNLSDPQGKLFYAHRKALQAA